MSKIVDLTPAERLEDRLAAASAQLARVENLLALLSDHYCAEVQPSAPGEINVGAVIDVARLQLDATGELLGDLEIAARREALAADRSTSPDLDGAA